MQYKQKRGTSISKIAFLEYLTKKRGRYNSLIDYFYYLYGCSSEAGLERFSSFLVLKVNRSQSHGLF